MTENEFLKIKENDVVSKVHENSEMYVVTDTDVMGNGENGVRVILAKQIQTDNPKYIRIDKGNIRFWEVVGKLTYQ